MVRVLTSFDYSAPLSHDAHLQHVKELVAIQTFRIHIIVPELDSLELERQLGQSLWFGVCLFAFEKHTTSLDSAGSESVKASASFALHSAETAVRRWQRKCVVLD